MNYLIKHMASKILKLLIILSLLSLFSINMVSAQDDVPNDVETSDVSDVPFLGLYAIPLLGALRRRRHELNNRSYHVSKINSGQIEYIESS